MSYISEGLDLSHLDTITPDEVNANLIHVYGWRGGTYEFGANALMLDYAPEFAKLHRWGSDMFGRPDPVNIILLGIQNQASYVMLGWETGILNQTISLRRNGMPKEQIMELVMLAQLYAGMRGLGHTFRAIGSVLPAIGDPPNPPAPFPAGWAADPAAFKCGLDLTTLEVTDADKQNLTGWYEQTIGYVPKSIQLGLRYHPEFVKMHRAQWEAAIRTLPKQVAPCVMLRLNMMSGSVPGLREAALLARTGPGPASRYLVPGQQETPTGTPPAAYADATGVCCRHTGEVEIRLDGGNVSGAVRVGDTVRRAVGPWTPAVQALLAHLAGKDFAGSPQPLGVDEQGREVLTFLPGETVGSTRPWPGWVYAEDTLVQVARWLRGFHDAVADFVPPEGAVWRMGGQWAPGLIIGHNDAAPYNAVWRDGKLAGFFDWDMAGPVRAAWDVAFGAFSWVPLHASHVVAREGFTDFEGRPRRLQLFLAEYGWTGPTSAFLEIVAARIQAHVTGLRDLAAHDPVFARIVTQGGAAALEAALAELAHFT